MCRRLSTVGRRTSIARTRTMSSSPLFHVKQCRRLYEAMVAREEEAEAVMWAAGYRAGIEDALRTTVPGLWVENDLLDMFARRVAGREEWPT